MSRKLLINRLQQDLMGPLEKNEIIEGETPEERYLMGILYPRNATMSNEEDDKMETAGNDHDVKDESSESVPVSKNTKPSSMGVSFCTKMTDTNKDNLKIVINLGIYNKREEDKIIKDKKSGKEKKRTITKWERSEITHEQNLLFNKENGFIDIDNKEENIKKGLKLFYKKKVFNDTNNLTLVLSNENSWNPDLDQDQTLKCFFQVSFKIIKKEGFAPRPFIEFEEEDEDLKSHALIYRNVKDYASGYNCTADWKKNSEGKIDTIEALWMVQKKVYSTNPIGDDVFLKVSKKLTASNFTKMKKEEIKKILEEFISLYQQWIETEKKKVVPEIKSQAEKHIKKCELTLARINLGIKYLFEDDNAYFAFQKANEAIKKQYDWKMSDDFVWRPFQISFFLINLEAIVNPNNNNRDIFDLLWFPTGGGKTEAYLFISSFLIFYSRLNDKINNSKGTQIIMRYTLRALSIDQFTRISSLICACEIIRLKNKGIFKDHSISLGLWVGKNQTPNFYHEAVKALNNSNAESTPRQLLKCPCCKKLLDYKKNDEKEIIEIKCINRDKNCEINKTLDTLPIITVDDALYKRPPSFLIATTDKFAQLLRKKEASSLFNLEKNCEPPSLIIQDELHLISGPLGTMTSIYELAIDELCVNSKGIRPKIIGSTATIKSAKTQVRSLFNRNSFQFPPPGIDEDNSCFAKKDLNSARIYVALSTIGRTAKYCLQAVSASLLQSIMCKEIFDNENKEFLNRYSTLVAYFNSLRILGGAFPMMDEQVRDTINGISNIRKEKKRNEFLESPEELTSRKLSSEIPKLRDRLDLNWRKMDFVDVLLATNMISVGIDIGRLNLMVVNGQPKTISEYIQSSSRVGRKKDSGIIVAIYNHSKIRDRNRYENFVHWHNEIYRGVEATSVTPFAPRSRDKALHSPLCILAMNKLKMKSPKLTADYEKKIREIIFPIILKKVESVDPKEVEATKDQLENILLEWKNRSNSLKYWWNHKDPKKSLLIAAESFAAKKATRNNNTDCIPTPNSLRDVEPSCEFRCSDKPRELKNAQTQ